MADEQTVALLVFLAWNILALAAFMAFSYINWPELIRRIRSTIKK